MTMPESGFPLLSLMIMTLPIGAATDLADARPAPGTLDRAADGAGRPGVHAGDRNGFRPRGRRFSVR